MKKITAAMALLLGFACLTGCGSQSSADSGSAADESSGAVLEIDNSDGKDEQIVMENGKTVTITDDGSFIKETDSGYEWSYLAGTCRMTFPAEWKDRFVVRESSVYSKEIFDHAENTGKLFTIDFMDDVGMLAEPKPSALLGVVNHLYVVAIIPEKPDFDSNDELFSAEYNDLTGSLSEVFQSAVCSGSDSFKPINLAAYEPAGESTVSKLLGTWQIPNTLEPGQFIPTVTFRSRDSAFGYKPAENVVTLGTFLVNRNAENYVWNTDNWGDAGLVFTGGKIFRATYYESVPETLEFSVLFSDDGASDSLTASKFSRLNDSQSISRSGTDPTEVELT